MLLFYHPQRHQKTRGIHFSIALNSRNSYSSVTLIPSYGNSNFSHSGRETWVSRPTHWLFLQGGGRMAMVPDMTGDIFEAQPTGGSRMNILDAK